MGSIVSPLLTSIKKLEVTYQTPYENLYGSPISLPLEEPGTSQIIYTVASADLPAFSVKPESQVYVALMYAGGRNPDATLAKTVYWRMVKNGGSVATGNFNVAKEYFWTLNAFFYNVVVGDVLELRFWSTSEAVYLDYEARQIQATRVALLERHSLLYLANYSSIVAQPDLTLGNPLWTVTYNLNIYHASNMPLIASDALDVSPWKQSATYKLWRIGYGDFTTSNNAISATSATYRPYYRRNYVPVTILLRALRKTVG